MSELLARLNSVPRPSFVNAFEHKQDLYVAASSDRMVFISVSPAEAASDPPRIVLYVSRKLRDAKCRAFARFAGDVAKALDTTRVEIVGERWARRPPPPPYVVPMLCALFTLTALLLGVCLYLILAPHP